MKEFEDESRSDSSKSHENKNGENEKRPKRFAAQIAQTFFLQEQTSVIFYKEQRDLKKAMRASLIEARRAKYNRNEIDEGLNQEIDKKELTSTNESIKNYLNHDFNNSFNRENISQTVNNKSNVNNRKTKIPAQRKFAQGSAANTPNSSPIKVKSKSVSNMSEVFTKHRPSTEDFLTFLCFRNTQFLPPHLDFYSLNKVLETSLCDSNLDEFSKEGILKENSFKSLSNNSKKLNIINNVKINKLKNFDSKNKFFSQESMKSSSENQPDKKIEKFKKTVKEKIHAKIENLKNDKVDLKFSPQFIKIETRGSTLKKEKAKLNVLNSECQTNVNANDVKEINVRILRSKRSITLPDSKSDNQFIVKNLKPNEETDEQIKKSHNSIGIRPHKRKAKPNALIDLHYILDEEEIEDCEKEILNKSGQKKNIKKEKLLMEIKGSNFNFNKSSQPNIDKLKTGKKKAKDEQVKKIKQEEKIQKEPVYKNKSKNKFIVEKELSNKRVRKETNFKKQKDFKFLDKKEMQEKVKKDFLIEKRITRSGASSYIKNILDVEARESFIKQKIIAIEQRHKSWQNFFSESSIHSSTESTTSSESLPSSSSSKSVNIPRLTRSLELIKQLRAKAKLENPKQEKTSKLNNELVEKLNKNCKVVNNKNLKFPKRKYSKEIKKNIDNKKLKNCQVKKNDVNSNIAKVELNLRSKSRKLNNKVFASKTDKKLDKLQACSRLIKIKSELNKEKLVKNHSLITRNQKKTKTEIEPILNNNLSNTSFNNFEINNHEKPTVDVSTFATEEDILACTGAEFDDYDHIDHQSLIDEFSVATQTIGPSDPLMLAMFGKLGFD